MSSGVSRGHCRRSNLTIERLFQLPISDKTIRNLRREAGLPRKKRRTPKTQQDLRAVTWCLQLDLDTKGLTGIPEPRPQNPSAWPARSSAACAVPRLRPGVHLASATLFAERLLTHLQQVSLPGCRIQTDHGSEFIVGGERLNPHG